MLTSGGLCQQPGHHWTRSLKYQGVQNIYILPIEEGGIKPQSLFLILIRESQTADMCRFLGHYDRPYTPGSVPGVCLTSQAYRYNQVQSWYILCQSLTNQLESLELERPLKKMNSNYQDDNIMPLPSYSFHDTHNSAILNPSSQQLQQRLLHITAASAVFCNSHRYACKVDVALIIAQNSCYTPANSTTAIACSSTLQPSMHTYTIMCHY